MSAHRPEKRTGLVAGAVPAAAPTVALTMASVEVDSWRWRRGEAADGFFERVRRPLAQETPVALTYQGATLAVMLATPCDLEDFALGFSLTEGLIDRLDEVAAIDVQARTDDGDGGAGIVINIWLQPGAEARVQARQRRLFGLGGCGLCGIEGLAEANRPLAALPLDADIAASPERLCQAMERLAEGQTLFCLTRAVHAAAWLDLTPGVAPTPLLIREDAGRHNALDKLMGAAARKGLVGRMVGKGPIVPAAVLLTSRVSVELVQKLAAMRMPIAAAISAPTAAAVALAQRLGITLAALVRGDGLEIFSHPQRLLGEGERGEA
jgi:FdhD protein